MSEDDYQLWLALRNAIYTTVAKLMIHRNDLPHHLVEQDDYDD